MSDLVHKIFAAGLDEHRVAFDRLDRSHAATLNRLVEAILSAWQAGGKLLICGNGGSAADSQHLAAELCGRYRRQRAGLPALSLTVDTSALTSIGNDFGFDQIFARQVEALAGSRDVLLVISTSGNSENCIAAVAQARSIGLTCHGLLGGNGGRLASLLDNAVVVPASDTPRIQEQHIFLIHTLCDALETLHAGEDA